MQRFSRYGWWSAALVTMIVLAALSHPRRADSDPPRSIDDWSIFDLVEHLNRMGVEVQLRSTQENGAIGITVFLTTTDKSWRRLNALNKDAKRIREWNGVVYCERVGQSDSMRAIHLWDDHGLAVGPFLFYGDAELLHRVRTALAPLAP